MWSITSTSTDNLRGSSLKPSDSRITSWMLLIGIGGVDVDVPESYVRRAPFRDGRKGGKETNGDDS